MAALIRWGLASELLEVFEVETACESPKTAENTVTPPPSVPRLEKNITPTVCAQKPPFDPFAFRVPFGSPQRLLAIVAPYTGWLFSSYIAVLATLATLWLSIQIGAEWNQFAASLSDVWLPQQQLWLLACWLLLKVVHESAHGLACIRFGGQVRDAGVSIIFGAPLPYIDVTSSWRFESRWQRILVSAAGMLIEWLVAIVAGFIWLASDDPGMKRLCAYIITVAAAGTILFNANPLVRFDGYYILVDLIDYPNLAARAQQFWKQAWLRWGWGLPGEGQYSYGEAFGLATYGLLSNIWRWGTLLALAIAAVELYEGFGIGLVALAAFLWFGRTVRHFINSLARLSQIGGRAALRPALILVGGITTCGLMIGFVPSPFRPQLWGVARHLGEVDVRTTAAGRVEQLLVHDGASVVAGDLLAILSDDELTLEVATLEAEIASGEVQARQWQQQRELVRWQVALERLAGLREQLVEKQREAEGLRIRAPQAGTVFAPRLNELSGRFLKRGDTLCLLGSPLQKEIIVAIPQDRLAEFAGQQHVPVLVAVPGRALLKGEIERIDPRGSTHPQDWSLATTNGGPLPVRQVHDQNDPAPKWELLSPHFAATVTIEEQSGSELAAGQRCRVVRADESTTLAQWLIAQGAAWTQRHRGLH